MDAQIDLKANTKGEKTSAFGLWQQIQKDWIAQGRYWTKLGFPEKRIYSPNNTL